MQFSQYLRTCREHSRLTQEQLVQALYVHDTESFEALDMSILSKWERGFTQPRVAKQVSIVKYFQQFTGRALPCLESYKAQEVEALICEVGMKNLLGKSKKLVLNYPSTVIGVDDLEVYRLRDTKEVDEYIAINVDLDEDFTHGYSGLRFDQFKVWAMNPLNTCFVCEYKKQFFGLLFSIRLKPEIFEKIIHHQLNESDIQTEDFAPFSEAGCNYILSFFAMNNKVSSMLFIRYYAHLIAQQNSIERVGLITVMEDAKKLISNMHFNYVESKVVEKEVTLESYQAELAEFLAHEGVMKMLFES